MNLNFTKYQMLNQKDETGHHLSSKRQNLPSNCCQSSWGVVGRGNIGCHWWKMPSEPFWRMCMKWQCRNSLKWLLIPSLIHNCLCFFALTQSFTKNIAFSAHSALDRISKTIARRRGGEEPKRSRHFLGLKATADTIESWAYLQQDLGWRQWELQRVPGEGIP